MSKLFRALNDFENAKICYERAAEINSLLYNAKYALAEIALIYKEIEAFSSLGKNLIAGGLIETREEVEAALDAGAIAVSTSSNALT